jgi:hypothetical protein
VAWQDKGSTTTATYVAYLLRLAALIQKEQKFNHHIISAVYSAGDDNRMADDASWLWKLNNEEVLTYLNLTYPQTHSWQLCQPQKALNSKVIPMLSPWTSLKEYAHQ